MVSVTDFTTIEVFLAAGGAVGWLAWMLALRKSRRAAAHLAASEAQVRDAELRVAGLESAKNRLERELAEGRSTRVALEENERRFRLLVERVDSIVWEFDPGLSRLLYVSPQAVRLGYPLEDWLKPKFWYRRLHRADRRLIIGHIKTAAATGSNHELQYRLVSADGSLVWVHDKVTVETRSDGSRLLRGVLLDITAQKKHEQALRESEERFTKAFHASPAISAITSFPDGEFLYVNEALLQAVKYERHELIGRTSVELGIWADADFRAALMQRLEAGEAILGQEYDVVDRHGCRRTLLGSLERIVVGGRQCILSINQDITERKQVELSLRESEERFAKAFHASPAITVIARYADGRYVDVNEQFTRTLGYTRDEVLGRTSLELNIWRDPALRQELMATLERNEPLRDWEVEFRDKSGQLHTMLLSVERVNVRGVPCVLGINHDITARKQAECLRDEQNAVLEMIAQGAPLTATLRRLLLAVESQAPGMMCSILLLDKDGRRLLHCAAPSLPDDYNRAIHGVAIGPDVGSCGTAAHLRQQVVVENIEVNPLWKDFRETARAAGLRACWSTPICDAHHQLLGTFAIYYGEPRVPDLRSQQLIATATHTAAICIKSAMDDATLRETALTLGRQNELLEHMGQLARIGAWSLDVETRALTWSEQTYAIHEVDPSVKPEVETAINFYAPEARSVIAAAVEAGMKIGTPWDLELPFVTARGRRLWVRAQGHVELAGGRPVRVYGAFQDITARKTTEEALRASEERFQIAMRGANDGLWDWDLKTDACYYSPRWKSMLGYGEDELADHLDTWKQLVDPDDRERTLNGIQQVLHGRDETIHLEFRMRHKDGHWVDILSRAFLVRDPGGVPARLVGTHVDITERNRAAEVQRQLEGQLRHSQKMEAIGTLAGGVAHDFNNILGAIIACAELARMDSTDNPAALANLDDLLKACHRARDLVKQILAFSRREEFERKVISLEPVILESVRLLRAAIPSTIGLRTSVIQPLPSVLADSTLVQQVIVNLVTNAAHAIGSRPGAIEVLVRLHRETAPGEVKLLADSAGSHVMIQVRDNGCGIEGALLERIFEPFFTTKGPGEGTGLGLSVAHGIVTAHGGAIGVESKPGEGSTFTVLLPAATVAPPALREPAHPSRLAGGSEHILIVDDEEPLLKVTERVLRRVGYRVTACATAAAALEQFFRSPDDVALIVTDYSMPGRTGVDFARDVFALRRDVPIIVCTGYSTAFTRDQALELGFCEFLHKPVEIGLLCRAIRSAIDRSTAARRQP